jgi:hypothetical protein
MKLYTTYKDGVWGEPSFRSDLLNTPKEEYNAQGIYDLEPAAGPEGDLNCYVSHELYLDDANIARYKWTKTLKTGEDLKQAINDKWISVRMQRDEMLAKTDYTQVADAPGAEELKVKWAEYRQALRNITLQADPFNLVWPTTPHGISDALGVFRV